MSLLKKILKWVIIVVVVAYAALVVGRMLYFYHEDDVKAEVGKIHATKLTMDDVMGTHLPPIPKDPDKTVQGVDANKNGIRDDVELAIFKAYPDSAKTRAVLLQYALALQTQMTLAISNKETVTATVEDSESRALNCIWSISSRADMKKFVEETTKNENLVKNLQLNTPQRIRYLQGLINKNLKSFGLSRNGCDLNLTDFAN